MKKILPRVLIYDYSGKREESAARGQLMGHCDIVAFYDNPEEVATENTLKGDDFDYAIVLPSRAILIIDGGATNEGCWIVEGEAREARMFQRIFKPEHLCNLINPKFVRDNPTVLFGFFNHRTHEPLPLSSFPSPDRAVGAPTREVKEGFYLSRSWRTIFNMMHRE